MYTISNRKGFSITNNPNDLEEGFTAASKDGPLFRTLLEKLVTNPNKATLKKIIKAVENNPAAYDYKALLADAYYNLNQPLNAEKILDDLLLAQPKSIIVRTIVANFYLITGRPEKTEEFLGSNLEIKELFPEREIFHEHEFGAYYLTVFYFWLSKKDLVKIEETMQLLIDVVPEDDATQSAIEVLEAVKKISAKDNMEDNEDEDWEDWEDENEDEDETFDIYSLEEPDLGNPLPPQKYVSPTFHHPEIYQLYQYGLGIEPKIINDILDLPRETLIADLELLLQDAAERFEYFENYEIDDEKTFFPIHGLLLLTELKSEHSLSKIFDALNYHDDYLEFWLGDVLYQHIWICFYQLGSNQLNVLRNFLFKENISVKLNATLATAIAQIAYQQPEKAKQVELIFKEYLEYFIQRDQMEHEHELEKLNHIIDEIISCKFTNLLPLIEICFERDWVDEFLIGNFKEIKRDIQSKKKAFFLPIPENIFSIYKDMLRFFGPTDSDDSKYIDSGPMNFDDSINNDSTYVRAENKIGRNDPCPCGSGKKYKKCCMENE